MDYIPGSDAEFDGWFLNYKNYLNEKTGGASPVWTHIPAAKVTALNGHWDIWHPAYVKTLGAHTSEDTLAKNNAGRSAKGFIRPLTAQYLKFEPVTDEDRLAMGVHVADTHRTSIPTPQSRAVFGRFEAIGGQRVRLWFQDENEETSHAIIYGMNGLLLFFTVSAHKVTDYHELTTTKLMTASPYTHQLDVEAEGQFFSFAAKWQNKKGELGPWSALHSLAVT